jgi:CheY-like chemotaxis protein
MLMPDQNFNEKSQSILIADDNEVLLEVLSEGFEICGFKVFKVNNGLDAWKLFNQLQIDIVLTDITMPGIDGAELSRRIRNESPETRIAVMSGGNSNLAQTLLEEGAADSFFKKPFALSYVCKTLTKKR